MTKLIFNTKSLKTLGLIAVFFLGISTTDLIAQKPRERVVINTVFDFRPYTAKSFYFSPNSYPSNFDPVAQINIHIAPAFKEVKEKNDRKGFGEIDEYDYTVKPEIISAEEMLELMYKKAISMGADAVTNLQIRQVYLTIPINGIPVEYLNRYEIEGFAIKRK